MTGKGWGVVQSVERSAVVCPPPERPATVRALFHNSTVDRASTGCLLEQAHLPAPPAPFSLCPQNHHLPTRSSLRCSSTLGHLYMSSHSMLNSSMMYLKLSGELTWSR